MRENSEMLVFSLSFPPQHTKNCHSFCDIWKKQEEEKIVFLQGGMLV